MGLPEDLIPTSQKLRASHIINQRNKSNIIFSPDQHINSDTVRKEVCKTLKNDKIINKEASGPVIYITILHDEGGTYKM